jgi:hypothetical protein
MLASQDRREVEAETIDVHLVDPVAQRVVHQPQCERMRQVERVSGAGVVDVAAAVLGQTVVGDVVDAAQRQRGP